MGMEIKTQSRHAGRRQVASAIGSSRGVWFPLVAVLPSLSLSLYLINPARLAKGSTIEKRNVESTHTVGKRPNFFLKTADACYPCLAIAPQPPPIPRQVLRIDVLAGRQCPQMA